MSKLYTKALNLDSIGVDSWDRTVYQDRVTAELFKDTSLNERVDHIEDLCSVSRNKFEGEPDTPIPFMSWGKSYIITLNYKDGSSSIFYKKLEQPQK